MANLCAEQGTSNYAKKIIIKTHNPNLVWARRAVAYEHRTQKNGPTTCKNCRHNRKSTIQFILFGDIGC